MVCSYWQWPRPRPRPIKNGLYRILWRYTHCTETETEADAIGLCTQFIGLGLTPGIGSYSGSKPLLLPYFVQICKTEEWSFHSNNKRCFYINDRRYLLKWYLWRTTLKLMNKHLYFTMQLLPHLHLWNRCVEWFHQIWSERQSPVGITVYGRSGRSDWHRSPWWWTELQRWSSRDILFLFSLRYLSVKFDTHGKSHIQHEISSAE